MMTVVVLVGFAAGVVGLLVVTPVLERWATSAPPPPDVAPSVARPSTPQRRADPPTA